MNPSTISYAVSLAAIAGAALVWVSDHHDMRMWFYLLLALWNMLSAIYFRLGERR